MAEDALVNDDIRSGRLVIEAVRGQGIPVEGAYWRHDADPGRWRLVLMSKATEQDGSLSLRQRIAPALDFDSLRRIEFKPPSDKAFIAAEKAAEPIAEGEGTHVYSLLFDGRYIDQAFVYRL